MYKVEYFNKGKRVVETQAVTLDYLGLTQNEKTFFQYMEIKGWTRLKLEEGDRNQDERHFKFDSDQTVYSINK